MKKQQLILCGFFVLCSISFAFSQNLLKPEWKFSTGDSMIWADPDFDDTGWDTIKAGELWENQGYSGYDGFGWYRTQVVIPGKLKAMAQKYGGFLLRLAKIDDVDETFFNGKHIGQNGQFPPDYKCQYAALREYAIPVEQIRWDQANTIAVRVFDYGGGGGIYDGIPELAVKGLADLVVVRVDLAPENHIFLQSESIKIPVVVANQSDESLKGELQLEIKSDFKEPIFSSRQAFQVKKQSQKKFIFQINAAKPGFYTGTAAFSSEFNNKIHRFGFGINPEQVISKPEPPADFAEYWQRAKKELAAVAPQYKMILIDSLCTSDSRLYRVEMRSLGNVLIRGWYSVPVQAGKYPTILHVQGYSSNVQPGWIYRGPDFVSFGLNIRGHGNSRDNVNPGFPGYLLYQLHDREMYIYRGAYSDCIRAVDFLFSRPEVDQSRVVVEGGSQGGALSFATAALNNDRIRLCVPNVPFLSDFHDYFKVAAWPAGEFANWVKAHPEVGWEGVYRTLSYIDIKNLAPWVKAPVLMGSGLLDEVCPPHINFAAYNNLSVPKEYLVYPYSGHGLPAEFHHAKMDWIRKQLGMK